MPLLAFGLSAFGLAIILLVVAAAPSWTEGNRTEQALAAIERHYARAASPAGQAQQPLDAPLIWLRDLGQRLSPSGGTASLQHRLDVAGNPQRWTADRFMAAKGVGLIALGALGALLGLHNHVLALAAAPLGAAGGLYLPDLLLYNAGIKRQERLAFALPDGMDLLTICVEAGLGFDAALARVASNSDGPLASEFSRVLREMQIGKSRTDALRALAARTTVIELRAFVSALIQASEMGIGIAHVLREQAREMRLRRRQRAEEQAQKVPVKILIPLMTCILPALFVIVIGPGMLSIVHALFHR